MKDDDNDEEVEESFFVRALSSVFAFTAINKKYIVLLASGVIVYFVMNQDFSSVMEDAVTAKPKPGTYWDADYANELIEQSIKRINSAATDLKKHKFEEALETYSKVDAELGAYSRKFKDQVLAAQITIQDYYTQIIEPLQDTVLDMTVSELAALRGGNEISSVYKVLQSDFYPLLSEEHQAKLDAELNNIDRARASLAHRRVRIEIVANDSRYTEMLENELHDAWNSDYDLELVFGPPLGEEEQRATWRSYKLVCEVMDRTYDWAVKDETDLKQALVAPPTIPVGLKVDLMVEAEADRAYPTSWDEATLIDVLNPAPDVLDVSDNFIKASVRLKKMKEKYHDRLVQQIEENLRPPQFSVFPDSKAKIGEVDVMSTPQDLMGMRQFALRDREGFMAQSLDWLADPSLENREEILNVWIEMNMIQLADSLVAELSNLDRDAVQRVSRRFQETPWWGDYRPAFELMKRSYYPSSISILEALVSRYDEPTVRNHLLKVLSKADAPYKQTLARLVVEKCPKSDLPLLLSYLHQIEGSVASVLFSEIYSRNEDLAVAWMEEQLLEMPERVQYAMINRHHFRTIPGSPPIVKMLVEYEKVYKRAKMVQFNGGANKSLQALILRKTMPLLHLPDVYAFAKNLDLSRVPMHLQLQFTRKLLHEHPKPRGSDYYHHCFELLKQYADAESALHLAGATENQAPEGDPPPEIIGYLLGHIFNWDDLPDSLKYNVISFFAERVDNPYLLRQIIYWLRDGEWDWTRNEIISLLEAGCQQPDLSLNTYSLIFSFPPETQKPYQAIIAQGIHPITGDERIRLAKERADHYATYRALLDLRLRVQEDIYSEWSEIEEGIEMRLSRPPVAALDPDEKDFFVRCELRNTSEQNKVVFPMARLYLKDATGEIYKCPRQELAEDAFPAKTIGPGNSFKWWQHGRAGTSGEFSLFAELDPFQDHTYAPSSPLTIELTEVREYKDRDSEIREELSRHFDAFPTITLNTAHDEMRLKPVEWSEGLLIGDRIFNGFVFDLPKGDNNDLAWVFTHTPRLGDWTWGIISESGFPISVSRSGTAKLSNDSGELVSAGDVITYKRPSRAHFIRRSSERCLVFFQRDAGFAGPKAISLNLLDVDIGSEGFYAPIAEQLGIDIRHFTEKL